MTDIKQKIIKNLCYTELVYQRINKKLQIDLSKGQIESFIYKTLQITDDKHYIKRGKNYYITNTDNNIRITINSNTFRVITAERIIK